MITWVDGGWDSCPSVATAPLEGIMPLIALNSYRCQMMASVVNRIQELGVEVEHIPRGCTALCQPLNVGLNKPLKCHIHRMWNECMLEEGILDGKAVPPTREFIVQWTIKGHRGMPGTCPGQVLLSWGSSEDIEGGQDKPRTREDMHTTYGYTIAPVDTWSIIICSSFCFVTQILLDKVLVGGQVPLMTQKWELTTQDMGLIRPVCQKSFCHSAIQWSPVSPKK